MRAPALLLLVPVAGCASPDRVTVAPAIAVTGVAAPAAPAANPLVAGVQLSATATIAASVALVPALATLTRAAAAAGLVETLAGPGPFTLFAPTDEAWGRLAPGTTDALLKPENRAALTKMLQLHLVPERLTVADLLARIAAGGGRATLTSAAGEPIALSLTGSVVTLTDAGGNKSYIETADVRQANGVIHVVNGVLVPRLN
jgi:uncharacterized surface protein with fasciclin (FAS1) repeats